MRVYLLFNLGFIAAFRQKCAHTVDDLGAGNHRAQFAVARIGFQQTFAQQHAQQADGVAQRAAADQSRQLFIFPSFTLAQVGITLGIVEIELQANHCQIIAYLALLLQ